MIDRIKNKLLGLVVNDETVVAWAKVQKDYPKIVALEVLAFPALFFIGFLDGEVSWSLLIQVLGKYTYGLMAFLFAYCAEPGNISTYTHAMLADPCSVECGLLSYLVLPSVHPIWGFILILFSAGSFFQLLWDSVLMTSLSFVLRVVKILKPITGHEGSADFGSVKFSFISPNVAFITLIIGFLLTRGNSSEVISALASMASGLLLVGALYILGIIAGIAGVSICGGGG